MEEDQKTTRIDVKMSKFKEASDVNGKGKEENRLRIVNAIVDGTPINKVGGKSPIGKKPRTASGVVVDEAAVDEDEE